MDRHEKTFFAVTDEESKKLHNSSVCVVGAGGLGGYAIEMLARLGIGRIYAVDGDAFDETNLNRQILSHEKNIGEKKIDAAAERVQKINSDVEFIGIHKHLDEVNAEEILCYVDVVIDCVDNIKTRYIMQEKCRILNIPIIHGAIGSWHGQVSTILPGDDTISKIYGGKYKGEIKPEGTSSFLPAAVAACQISECVKVILNKGEILQNKVMFFDFLNNQFFAANLNEKD